MRRFLYRVYFTHLATKWGIRADLPVDFDDGMSVDMKEVFDDVDDFADVAEVDDREDCGWGDLAPSLPASARRAILPAPDRRPWHRRTSDASLLHPFFVWLEGSSMRPFLAHFAILSVVQLVTAGALAGQNPWSTQHEYDQGPAKLTLCNHGERTVSVAFGFIDLGAFRHSLTISAWTNVKGGRCDVIYVSEHNLSVPPQSYVAFAYFDQQGQFTAAQVTSTPDIGEWSYYSTLMHVQYPRGHGPALTRASRRLCVTRRALEYSIPVESNPDCSTLRAAGVSGEFRAIDAQFLFHPSARNCSDNVYAPKCEGGIYFLDVAPRTGDLDLRASHEQTHSDESVPQMRTPAEKVGDMVAAAAIVAVVGKMIADGGKPFPLPRPEHEPSSWDEVRPLFWKSPIQSVSGYHPSWVKQVVSVRGTVSRVEEKPQMFTTIHFRESANLVLCANYTNFLKRTLAPDLSTLVGRVIEFTGQVEQFEPCGATADIRALEPEQLRLVSK